MLFLNPDIIVYYTNKSLRMNELNFNLQSDSLQVLFWQFLSIRFE